METTENNLYALLIGISQDVGEIKSDIKNLNNDIKEVQQKTDNDYKALKTTVESHETRISKLENSSKNKLWALWEKFKFALVSAIILALVGCCMKFATDLIQVVKTPVVAESK